MKIQIIKLIIENFKGIKKLETNFGKVTNIYGENGIGKTTVPDSFSFLMFDKDSKDSSKFDVQPLDKNNNPIHNLETVIEATLIVDGKEITLKRIYKEKYSKVKGTSRQEFKGYESQYYVNEVPYKVTEYKKFISSLLDENIFKLVTNPVYFSNLPWKERRDIITEIVGDLDNIVVLDSKKELEPLRKHLEEYTVNEFMKMNKAKINKLKEDRCKLPVRIDEANKSIQEFDFKALEVERKELAKKVKEVDAELIDKSKSSEGLYKLKSELMEKKSDLEMLQYRLKSDKNKPLQELEEGIRILDADINHINIIIKEYEDSIRYKQSRISRELEPRRLELLEKHKKIKSSSFFFDESECTCPTCKRRLEEEDIQSQKESMESNFNLNKAKKTEEIIRDGKGIKENIAELNTQIKDLENKIDAQKNEINSKENMLVVNKNKYEKLKLEVPEEPKEFTNAKEEIKSLEDKIDNFKEEDVSDIKARKQDMQLRISEIDRKLAFKEANKKTLERIEKLEAEESKLSEKIAELEGLEMLSEDFIRTKVELLEEKVDSKFKYVSFKMFRNQINGGLEECCEPCVDGVPFTSNLNTAAKINAGLDIINTLCSHYNVNAPIFIDNRESTNKIIDVDSQVINLIVSQDKQLKVEVM